MSETPFFNSVQKRPNELWSPQGYSSHNMRGKKEQVGKMKDEIKKMSKQQPQVEG